MTSPKQPVKGRMRTPPKVKTHVFHNGGQTNHAGVGICEFCGGLRTHRIHDLNEDIVAEAAELDARKMGEAE